ncbi:hypothetical protein D3C73_1065020 [compost metagenome]
MVGSLQDAVGALYLPVVWQVYDWPGSAQQPGQGHDQQQYCAAHGGAQAAWGIGVKRELPPQLMAVGHVLVGKQQ